MIFILKIDLPCKHVSKRHRALPFSLLRDKQGREKQVKGGGVEGKGVFWDAVLLAAFRNTLFPTTEGRRGQKTNIGVGQATTFIDFKF